MKNSIWSCQSQRSLGRWLIPHLLLAWTCTDPSIIHASKPGGPLEAHHSPNMSEGLRLSMARATLNAWIKVLCCMHCLCKTNILEIKALFLSHWVPSGLKCCMLAHPSHYTSPIHVAYMHIQVHVYIIFPSPSQAEHQSKDTHLYGGNQGKVCYGLYLVD